MNLNAIRPGVLAVLDRHERKREEGLPCVSVLVGNPGLSLYAVGQWSEERNRTLVEISGKGLDAPAEAWFAGLAQRRDLVRDAVAWLAQRSRRSAEELSGWIARASPYDVERFLDTTLPGEPAEVCRCLLKLPTPSREIWGLSSNGTENRPKESVRAILPGFLRTTPWLSGLARPRPVPDRGSAKAVRSDTAKALDFGPIAHD